MLPCSLAQPKCPPSPFSHSTAQCCRSSFSHFSTPNPFSFSLTHTHAEGKSGSVPNPFHVIKYKEDNLYNIPQNYYFPTTGWWIVWHLLATSSPHCDTPLSQALTNMTSFIFYDDKMVQRVEDREESASDRARDTHKLYFRKYSGYNVKPMIVLTLSFW